MDSKIVFVRTSKGEDEMHSRTMHLPGDIKRALLMVDGSATCGEISKRAAPSLRADLDAMFQELEKGGFIIDKARAGNLPKISVPPKMSAPHKPQPVDDGAGDLDFMSGFSAASPKAPETGSPGLAANAERVESEARAKQEIEAAELKAQHEAEALLQKAAQEAARIREEAEREKQRIAAQAKAEAEAQARALIESKASQEAEAARIKAENEVRAHAEAMARREIEAARLQAQQQAEAARLKAEQEVAKAREEAAASLRAQQKAEAMLIKSVQDTAQSRDLKEADKQRTVAPIASRTTSATVLFFDMVGYTRQPVNKQIEIKKQFNQLVSACLKVAEDGERIILDTGDGAAIGFLQHPDDALEVAIKFRNAVAANQHLDYPDLKVRIGIHLGPINVAKDMNGRSNMVGDGINDAQRVMNFAGIDQIYISRPYYDFISRLKDEYADMFQYRGMQADKHGREHPVYEFVNAASAGKGQPHQAGGLTGEIQLNPFATSAGTAPAAKPEMFAFDAFHIDAPQSPTEKQKPIQSAQQPGPAAISSADKPEVFSFGSFNVDTPQPPVEPPKKVDASPVQQPVVAARATPPAETRQPVRQEAPPVVANKPVGGMPSEEEIQRATQERIATEKRMEEEALVAKKHAEAQAKAHAEAEHRAAEAAGAEIEQATKQVKYTADAAPVAPVAKQVRVARTRRQPFSWGKLAGWFVKLGVFLLVLLVGALFVVPYVLPMRDYIPKIEGFMSAKLHQPVHIGHLSARILPTPRMQLGEITIGEAKQFQAEQAQVNFAITGLFLNAKPIDSIEFLEVKVNGAALLIASRWMQQMAADNQYPVARIAIRQGAMEANAIKLTGVEGVLDFNNIGEFTKANLRANEGKYMLDINPALGSKLNVDITVRNSALPLLPNWQFDELTAKAELSGNDLSISEFNGQISGGVLQGSANINWRSGWVVQGNMAAKKMTLQRLNKLLDGNIDGSARFKMTALDMAGLADSAALDGSFTAKDGTISGMDIVATARSRSREHLPGGRTHFDELGGIVAYANNTLRFKQVKITTNVLNAVATLDIDSQQLSGNLAAALSMQDGTKPVDLQIAGTIDSPILRFVP